MKIETGATDGIEEGVAQNLIVLNGEQGVGTVLAQPCDELG